MEKNIFIVVPTKNSWFFLKKLVESLKKQTDPNFRVLFVDSDSCEKHQRFISKISKEDTRFLICQQNYNESGIYQAMNSGFIYAKSNEWLLFWGSDDFASSENTISSIRKILNDQKKSYDLDMIIFKGEFIDLKTSKLNYLNHFSPFKSKKISKKEYKNMLLSGFRQAHQATLINPEKITLRYDTKYFLAADLNFYLQSTRYEKSTILLYDKHIVNIGFGGISRRKHILRTYEVALIYLKNFKLKFLIPLISRYFRFI